MPRFPLSFAPALTSSLPLSPPLGSCQRAITIAATELRSQHSPSSVAAASDSFRPSLRLIISVSEHTFLAFVAHGEKLSTLSSLRHEHHHGSCGQHTPVPLSLSILALCVHLGIAQLVLTSNCALPDRKGEFHGEKCHRSAMADDQLALVHPQLRKDGHRVRLV